MPRGVYDRSKSKTEGPKAAKPATATAKPAAQKTASKTGPKQVAKAVAAKTYSGGRAEQFTALTQSIATLAALNPALCKNAAARAEAELIAQIDALSDLRKATFGRTVAEQTAYDAEQVTLKAQRDAARAAQQAAAQSQTAQETVEGPGNGQVPLPARPIMPVPPAPVSA